MSENVPHAPPLALSGDATCRVSNERLFGRINDSLCSRTPSFVRRLSFLLARMEFLLGTRAANSRVAVLRLYNEALQLTPFSATERSEVSREQALHCSLPDQALRRGNWGLFAFVAHTRREAWNRERGTTFWKKNEAHLRKRAASLRIGRTPLLADTSRSVEPGRNRENDRDDSKRPTPQYL